MKLRKLTVNLDQLMQAGQLRVYAHAIQDEESDLSFANFGDSKRLYPAPTELAESAERRNPLKSMVGRQGLEPWTIGLKARHSLIA